MKGSYLPAPNGRTNIIRAGCAHLLVAGERATCERHRRRATFERALLVPWPRSGEEFARGTNQRPPRRTGGFGCVLLVSWKWLRVAILVSWQQKCDRKHGARAARTLLMCNKSCPVRPRLACSKESQIIQTSWNRTPRDAPKMLANANFKLPIIEHQRALRANESRGSEF